MRVLTTNDWSTSFGSIQKNYNFFNKAKQQNKTSIPFVYLQRTYRFLANHGRAISKVKSDMHNRVGRKSNIWIFKMPDSEIAEFCRL